MASTLQSMSTNPKISVTKARRERQKAAMAESGNEIQAIRYKLEALEDTVAQLAVKVERSIPCPLMPPGLSDPLSETLQARLDRLEILLICSPSMSPDVDTVLSKLLEKCNKMEPDRELSPIKEMEEDVYNQALSTRACPNFDIYSEAHRSDPEEEEEVITDPAPKPETALIDPMSKCIQLAQSLEAEVHALPPSSKRELFESDVLSKFECLLAECPLHPKTSLPRPKFTKSFDNMHCEWYWQLVCKKHHNGTGDPECKTDLFINMMYVVHCLWKGHTIPLHM